MNSTSYDAHRAEIEYRRDRISEGVTGRRLRRGSRLLARGARRGDGPVTGLGSGPSN